jgi:hypothetical protein
MATASASTSVSDEIEDELAELRRDLAELLEISRARGEFDWQLHRAVERLMSAHRRLMWRVGHAAERVEATRNTRWIAGRSRSRPEHDVSALTDFREVDRTIALARAGA